MTDGTDELLSLYEKMEHRGDSQVRKSKFEMYLERQTHADVPSPQILKNIENSKIPNGEMKPSYQRGKLGKFNLLANPQQAAQPVF